MSSYDEIEEKQEYVLGEDFVVADEVNFLRVLESQLHNYQDLRIRLGNKIEAAIREGVITSKEANRMNDFRERAIKIEKDLDKELNNILKKIPVYNSFFKTTKGAGPRLSAAIISQIGDIRKFRNVSNLWSYAGYRIDADGRAVRRKRGEVSNWNSYLKSRLYNLAESFLKVDWKNRTARTPGRYRKAYDDYKHRMSHRKQCHLTRKQHSSAEDSAATWLKNGCTKGHVHNMSLRFVQKLFLMDLFFAWYDSLGINPPSTYAEDFLQRFHQEHRFKNLTPKRKRKKKTVSV